MTARLFADLLREINKGECHQEVSLKLQELVSAVAESGKAGSLTLKLEVKPQGMDNVVGVKAAVTIKKPEVTHKPSLFFITEEFNLSRRDPRQYDLEDNLRVVEDEEEASA